MSTPSDNLDEFIITFRREIIFYLRQLINDSVQLTVVFNHGKDSLLTMLLDVNEETDTLIFDWGGSEEANQKFLQSEKNNFVARPHGIRNQFVTGHAKQVTYNGQRAFAVKIPEKYLRLQRREFFRLTLPMTQRPICTLRAPDGREMKTDVVDIGLGGLALEVTSLLFPCELGMSFPAMIEIKDQSVLRMDIRIRYVGTVERGVHRAVRLGCNFEKVTAGQENEMQKFISQVQREERAKLGR
jgi:c-di-GMP-binding flagellar brake protein YcgR